MSKSGQRGPGVASVLSGDETPRDHSPTRKQGTSRRETQSLTLTRRAMKTGTRPARHVRWPLLAGELEIAYNPRLARSLLFFSRAVMRSTGR